MDVTVRSARKTDVTGVQAVARQSWHAAHDHIIGDMAVTDFLQNHYNDERLREIIVDPDGLFLVAEVNKSGIVGFTGAVPWRDSDRTFALGSLYVHPQYWREGIGSQLIDEIETEIQSLGGEYVRLVVMAENDVGIQFYESTGFDRTDDHYDDTLDVHGYVYTKEL